MQALTELLAATTLEQFRGVYEREHATTRNVLAAFPADQASFRPHERSSTAQQLAWTFVIEELIMLKVLQNEAALGGGVPKAPDAWQEILDAFDDVHALLLEKLQSVEASTLQSVKFFVAPKTPGDYAPLSFIWRFLFDQIHHRGQMSVYLRMVGGKVPSIYGPSGDEPWF
jgi:uncharacterized damage-inducible protein DinB